MNPAFKDALFRVVTTAHIAMYRSTGGLLGGRAGRAPMLLLTTTGRRTGRPRSTPLVYLQDGERLVLVASYGGDDRAPQWFRNLVADPDVGVQIGSTTRRMRAAVASPGERAAYWPRVVALWPGYEAYQRRTTRTIPLVVLTPAPAGDRS